MSGQCRISAWCRRAVPTIHKWFSGGSYRDSHTARISIPCVACAIRRGRTHRGRGPCARVRASSTIRSDNTIQSKPTKATESIRSGTLQRSGLDIPEVIASGHVLRDQSCIRGLRRLAPIGTKGKFRYLFVGRPVQRFPNSPASVGMPMSGAPRVLGTAAVAYFYGHGSGCSA